MVYENNIILRTALEKTLSSFERVSDNIILINISYSVSPNNCTPYSGMEYIVNLRWNQKGSIPVIFYGFENLACLRKKPEASILNSPAVEYIKMPFQIKELSEKLLKVVAGGTDSEGLDKKTKKSIALDKLRIFKHDVINAMNTVKTVYKLKRNGSRETQKANWSSVAKTISMAEDLIRRKIMEFEAIENTTLELLAQEAIKDIKGILANSDDTYKTLIKRLDSYSESERETVISEAEDIVSLLNKTIKNLEKVEV